MRSAQRPSSDLTALAAGGSASYIVRAQRKCQMRKVQRRFCRGRGWRRLGVTAGWIKLPTEERAQDVGRAGKTLTESTAGGVRRTSGRQGGARFTGASASLKAVWGESARGTADTPTAATKSNKISVK